MDPGHFLTNSGSKIPMPKSKKENIAPQKPKLTVSKVTTTSYKCDAPDEVVTVQKPVSQTAGANSKFKVKTTASQSVPNLTKTTTVMVRSKTNVNGKGLAPGGGIKRTAAATESADAPAQKQPKAAPKSGFPYKAKNWELKARLAECEGWVTDLRTKCTELESQFIGKQEEVQNCEYQIEQLDNERGTLEMEVASLKSEKLSTEHELRSKSEAYDKLYNESKHFLSEIETLNGSIAAKDTQIKILQTDQIKLRDDLASSETTVTQLRTTVGGLEFTTNRQKNQIEDLEKLVEQLRKESLDQHCRLRERDNEIADLRDKLGKSERDNKIKTCSLSDLESDFLRAKEEITNLKKELTNVKSENYSLKDKLDETISTLTEVTAKEKSATTTCEELKKKLCENEKLRRYLHNAVQDLKGNIRVFCRVRPPIASERSVSLCTITFPNEGSLEISKGDPFVNSNSAMSRPKFVKHEFSFDRVFNPTATQEDVFDELAQLVQSALDGYNVCVFAYGQTGSGKTYTMEGENSEDLRGMIPRTVDHIFKSLKELEAIGWEYTVEVSFLEIYNENIRDLLRNDKDETSLKIMQIDTKTNDMVVPGLTVMKVDSYEDLDRLYLLAHQNRAVAYTSCNERSSRSHSVTKIKVTGTHTGRGERCYGSLYLVDLAGSERLNEPMSDPRFREMKNINKSLSELGNVVLGLLQKQEYIPYRNSKLTHLLQPALGGSSKTLMLVNISPAEHCLQETLCSLRFAEKVNKVKMGVTKKRITYENANIKG